MDSNVRCIWRHLCWKSRACFWLISYIKFMVWVKSHIFWKKKYVDDLEPCPIISETCDKEPYIFCTFFRRINKFILLWRQNSVYLWHILFHVLGSSKLRQKTFVVVTHANLIVGRRRLWSWIYLVILVLFLV